METDREEMLGGELTGGMSGEMTGGMSGERTGF